MLTATSRQHATLISWPFDTGVPGLRAGRGKKVKEISLQSRVSRLFSYEQRMLKLLTRLITDAIALAFKIAQEPILRPEYKEISYKVITIL